MAKPEDVETPDAGEDQPQMSVTEQLRVQTELGNEEEAKRTPAPKGKTRQLLVVMRHGERIDEVCCMQKWCQYWKQRQYQQQIVLQVDKQWSAIAPRPYDPFLSEHGEEQVGPHSALPLPYSCTDTQSKPPACDQCPPDCCRPRKLLPNSNNTTSRKSSSLHSTGGALLMLASPPFCVCLVPHNVPFSVLLPKCSLVGHLNMWLIKIQSKSSLFYE